MGPANTINRPDIDAKPAGDVRFESKLTVGAESITASYTVANGSDKDIYVLDAYPGVDEYKQAHADLKAFYLSFRQPSTAFVLKGVPPPPSMPVARRVMPLGTRLAPAATLKREFQIPLPLRERSDWYYPPRPVEEYTSVSIEKITFLVQFIRSTAPEFKIMPVHYAPEFFIVEATEFVKHVETLKQDFPTQKMQLFTRKDQFSRL